MDILKVNFGYVSLPQLVQRLFLTLCSSVSFFLSDCSYSQQLKGCPSLLIPLEITILVEFIVQYIPELDNLNVVLQQYKGSIQQICGANPEPLLQATTTVDKTMCKVANLLADVREYFYCANWYPLYEVTVYDALCYNGIQGFAWVATTQFVIVFMTMIMLTLRTTFYSVQYEDTTKASGMEDDPDEIGSGPVAVAFDYEPSWDKLPTLPTSPDMTSIRTDPSPEAEPAIQKAEEPDDESIPPMNPTTISHNEEGADLLSSPTISVPFEHSSSKITPLVLDKPSDQGAEEGVEVVNNEEEEEEMSQRRVLNYFPHFLRTQ